MYERFTDRAKKVVILAREEATRLNHDYIGPEHLLLGLIRTGEGVAAEALRFLGLELETIRREVEKEVQHGPSQLTIGEVPFTPRSKKVIELAMDEARAMGHNYIGTEHLLLGLIREEEGVAARVLQNLGVDLQKVRQVTMELLGGPGGMEPAGGGGMPQPGFGPGGPSSQTKTKTPALDAFSRDLSQLARQGKLDPVIGRKDEIERVIRILSRRTKNNPVLLGEAGVGKTAIVEGIAQQIVSDNVPELLRHKRVLILDLALMVAGTKYRGQFEERIKAVMQEIKRTKDIIIFIDELHTLVGAGGAEGAIDASNILKPALTRGEMQCVGATTLNEYRKYIEKDAALERRFQTIIVNPPSVEETIEILKGLRDRYEAHHRVKFSDGALVAAAKLSDRYIAGRFLPDKAIDVIDEAGAKARLAMTTLSPDVKKMEKEIERLRKEKEASVKAQEFETAAKYRDDERKLKAKLSGARKEKKVEKETVVNEEDIAEIVSKWTGVPIGKLEEKESEKMLHMAEEIKEKIIGQDEAVVALTRAIRRSRAGLKDPQRPIGSFIFLGPTGVGKTKLGRVLAEFLFGDADAILQVDMSEYMEKFAVSRLVGAPPGYVGYDEGGQLTEKVRRRPYCVILLDEIEKAHPDVFNILLQVIEDGRLTDSFGRTVDFRNTILIMTSNIGTENLVKGSLGFQATDEAVTYEAMKKKLTDQLKKTFRPEFLNRVDEVVIFRSLGKEELKKIVDIELEDVKARLKAKGIEIELNSKTKDFLIERGYDQNYGARPLRRAIQRYVEDPLAEEMLKKKFEKSKVILVDVDKAKTGLTFKEKGVNRK